MENKMLDMIKRRAAGEKCGIYSACTASAAVIEAVLLRAGQSGQPALIEATANQVNQFGGYTGMTPRDYASFVYEIADKTGFDRGMLILGGDHLGPLTWKGEPEQSAMDKAETLIEDFMRAGFSKIHIDTSMRLKDDSVTERLSDAVIARRAARLAAAAQRVGGDAVYIIGSEVPVPGGAQEEEAVAVTAPEDFERTLESFRQAFEKAGANQVWSRVIGVVVQPGVEFGDASVHHYDRNAAKKLTAALKNHPGIVFEGHSTDYQTPENLRRMVEDGVAILKVGPALTFYQREALFALSMIERELLSGADGITLSNFDGVLEQVMLEKPGNWNKYYHGDAREQRIKRRFSFSDRSRYYMPDPLVAQAVDRLFENLNGVEIPWSLLSQYMPVQALKARAGEIRPEARELLRARVCDCIDEYLYAVGARAR